MGIETADGTGDLGIGQNLLRGELVQSGLTDEELVVGEVVRLHYVNLLLYLTDDLDDLVLVAPGGDGVLMHAGDARGRHIEALDVHLTAGEDGRDLVQNTGHVLGVNQ